MATILRNATRSSGTATEADVRDCYRLFLGREPDEAGLAFWRTQMERQATTLEELTRGFAQSGEFLARHRLKPAPGGPGRGRQPPPTGPDVEASCAAFIARSRDHAFLDRAWIGWLLRATPRGLRTPLALRLLSLSPHYWVYQWTRRYPAECSRGTILAREFARNADSRREIYDKILLRFVRPGKTVLDFGCGPGFLAKRRPPTPRRSSGWTSPAGRSRVRRSSARPRTSPTCANGPTDLSVIADGSVDLVYSFAVFQHLKREQTLAFFREFGRVLRPHGEGVFHTILKKDDEEQYAGDPGGGWLEKNVHLRMVYLSADEIAGLLDQAGFVDVRIRPIDALADIEDDIGREHLVTFRR